MCFYIHANTKTAYTMLNHYTQFHYTNVIYLGRLTNLSSNVPGQYLDGWHL